MSENRIFTEEELKKMGIPTLDQVLKAIDSGDKDEAKRLASRMKKEFNHLHDGYMVWVTGLLSYIYRNYGMDAVEEAEKEAHGIEGRTVFKSTGTPDYKTRVKRLAAGLKGHFQPLEIKEDDEKVTITMKPCGSGERLIQMGGYEPDFGLLKVKEPHNATWGKKDFPMYCVHCPVMEMLDFENDGQLGVVHLVEDPMKFGECHFAIYKDPKDIPEECYTRIGKKKP